MHNDSKDAPPTPEYLPELHGTHTETDDAPSDPE
jgi:hypothetical protein